jgi:hypothetical protein
MLFNFSNNPINDWSDEQLTQIKDSKSSSDYSDFVVKNGQIYGLKRNYTGNGSSDW